MSWETVIGHAAAIGRLRGALAAGRLHPVLLFEGPEGVGKRLVALTLARALHCSEASARGGDPCGVCRVCTAIASAGDPEWTEENQSPHGGIRVVTPSRPDEREAAFGGAGARGEVRSQITVPQIRVLLTESLAGGVASGPRVTVIDPADRMNESASNALLKTLEEPRSGERFVLLSARPSALLPTIRSRCVRFRFGTLPRTDVLRALGEGARGTGAPPADPGLIAALAGGRIGRARQLAETGALAAFSRTRLLLLEALEARARGLPAGTFALVAAASFSAKNREEWRDALGILEILLRDCAVLAADPEASLVNGDLAPRLRAIAPALGPRAARALAVLDAVRGDLRFNVNGRLAAERVLLEVGR